MILVLLAVAYLLGSIPFGMIIGARFYGVNIARKGSGNIGATNVFRVLGPKAGSLVLGADILKGFVAIKIVQFLAPGNIDTNMLETMAAACVVLGHSMSIFLSFSGGKGVATAAGALLAIMPKILLILLAVWILIILITRYVSLASIVVAMTFPVITIFLDQNTYRIALSFAVCLTVLIKHRANLVRLIKGTENKFSVGQD